MFFNMWKDEFAQGSEHKYEDHMQLVQFHPSFSYEDFMEGLRPILDVNGESHLTLQNGVFKEFCRNAGKWEIEMYKLLDKDNEDKEWEKLTIKDLSPYRDELKVHHWEHVLKIQDPSRRVADAVPPFFFIIDEINRADLSRVFGELMYCLEYRGVQEGCITTQYANLDNKNTGMLRSKDQRLKFFIPSNVYLIGTMNTIDRSVESFDFALRRRFRWEEITPDYDVLEYHLSKHHKEWAELADNLKNLNKKIEEETLLGIDYKIGHAYLMNLKYSTRLGPKNVRAQVWNDRISPLLQEYLRGTGRSEELMETFRSAFEV